MCGIGGHVSLRADPIPHLATALELQSALLQHRGPDGSGIWTHPSGMVGFAHRRLNIIDLETGDQPMTDGSGNWIVYNGEIYNYLELRDELGADTFRTHSDTEVILRAYRRWGLDFVSHLRGMFAFALWDEGEGKLVLARDRFGMKPLYFSLLDDRLIFASEVKGLLPFMPGIDTDLDALKDYLAFQFCLAGKTLFKGVRELPAAHLAVLREGSLSVKRYWDVTFDHDWGHTSRFFEDAIRAAMEDSVDVHLRADVPIGAYLSGGLDSSIVATLAARRSAVPMTAYTGRFDLGPDFDETPYARDVASAAGLELRQLTVTPDDFEANIRRVLYHLDFPVAGPGAFPQFMVSGLVSTERKVALGGQGGDELFGGYARYLIAYFEQCLKGAIDGTMNSGNFIVSYESILPNLTALRRYKPLMQDFWREGMFEDMDRRYFRLVNRSPTIKDEVRWELLGDYSPFETFLEIFNSENLAGASYFDRMTHFDFKTLLPALLQVEDRVSMAHGVESRLPFLDHPLVELAATIPSNIKFEGGQMKRVLKAAFAEDLPRAVVGREDKMGFPTPLNDWARGPLHDFVMDVMTSRAAKSRDLIDNPKALAWLSDESRFGRNFWGLLSLELWQQEFHDNEAAIKASATGAFTHGDAE
jgi:asparagine synthase (glutamine-hydrolysing)